MIALLWLTLVVSASVIPPCVSASAVGVGATPTDLRFELARDEHAESHVLFITSDGTPSLDVITRGTAASWLHILDRETGAEVSTIQPGPSQRIAIVVRVEAPSDAANGRYTAAIIATAATAGDVSPSVEIPVYIDVSGDQSIRGRLVEIVLPPIAEIETPYIADLTIENEGNVAASVTGRIKVTGSNGSIAEVTVEEEDLKPGVAKTVRLVWDPIGLEPGAVDIQATAWLAGLEVGTASMDVVVLETGSANRTVDLSELALAGPPRPGGVTTIHADYVSTAQVPVQISFSGSVERDGEPAETVGSIGIDVMPGESGSLDVFVTTPVDGTYVLHGGWVVDGIPGPTTEISWQLGRPFPWSMAGAVGLGVLFCVLAVIAVARVRQSYPDDSRSRGGFE